ncbi:MAG TPA: hypothetical protein PKZ76_09555 [Xanthomonadaceae bacterium]|nr:hypothetical protein [Xanthomonadaceae bacterium]
MTRIRLHLALTVLVVALSLSPPPSLAVTPDTADFERFLASYLASSQEHRRELLDTFVHAQSQRSGFPITDAEGYAVFVWLGDSSTRDVRLVGDFARKSAATFAWDPEGLPMAREGLVYHLRLRFEPDARLDYAFLVDGERRLDPLNPDTIVSGPGDGEASVLSMPAHRVPHWAEPRPGIPRGRVETVEAAWATPRIHV